MAGDIKPTVKPVSMEELRPTQITVGMREVALKRHEIRAMRSQKAGSFLGNHLIPAVLGPKDRYHIVDHHHLALALHEEGVKEVLVNVVGDLSALDKKAFLTVLDNRAWMHPFDASGKRRSYADIPKSIDGLVDDPYRSLAGEVRRLGGYAKDTTPFAEFLWADFFRRCLDVSALENDFDRVAGQAVQLARQKQASYLPGWSGPEA